MKVKYKAKVKYLKERVGVLTHNLIEATQMFKEEIKRSQNVNI